MSEETRPPVTPLPGAEGHGTPVPEAEGQDAETDSGAPLPVVEGPSFPWTVKAAASALVGALAYFAWHALDAKAWSALDTGGRLFLVAASGVAVSGWWGVLTSRTRFDGEQISQSWLWAKSVQLRDVTQVKLIHLRGLEWIIVPRLLVRAGGLGLTTFHASDPDVLAAFRRLAYGD